MRTAPAAKGLFLLAASFAAEADTTIVGGNIINQTWTPAGSPYIVQGDITVPAGSFLVVEAGTLVRLASTDSQGSGLDPARVEVTVRGTFQSGGTAANPVQFVAQTGTAAGTWYGIVVDPTATSAAIVHTELRHATQAVRANVAGEVLALSLSRITGSTVGLVVVRGEPIVSSMLIHGNTSHGVFVQAAAGVNASVTVLGSTVHGNGGTGVRVEAPVGSTATATVRDSNVTQNGGGVHRITGAGATLVLVTHSNIWGNTLDYLNVVPGAGAIAANPLYVSPPSNFRLTSNSPSRFAGFAGSDLGPLPYAGDPAPGLIGTLWSDVTLVAANSPYFATGDLTVASGATLTVQPGVELRFASGDGMVAGFDAVRPELIVRGVLSAAGTVGAPITFASTGSAADAWRGIVFPAGAPGASISHAIIADALIGVDLLSATTHVLSNLEVAHCTTGLRAASGTLLLDASTVSGCVTGISVTGDAGGTISNTIVRSNTGDGLNYAVHSGSSTLLVTHATVHANGLGIIGQALAAATGSLTIVNSIVTNNAGAGVVRNTMAGGSITVVTAADDVWSNSPNYHGLAPGPGSLGANPLYVAPPNDLRVQPGSIVIDAGSPIAASDHDRLGRPRPIDGDGFLGAAFDMGAYELIPAVAVTIAAGSVSQVEGTTGTAAFSIPVTLSSVTAGVVTVDWTTSPGTAAAGSDFVATSGTLEFDPGETSAHAVVAVIGDASDEFDESFSIVLSGATGNATIDVATGQATIGDDDAPPTIAIADFGLCEGASGLVPVGIDVPSGKPVSVTVTSADDTAQAPADYAAIAATASIAVGATGSGVAVSAAGDTLAEPTEGFLVTLSSPVNSVLGDSSAFVLVFDTSDPVCTQFADGFE